MKPLDRTQAELDAELERGGKTIASYRRQVADIREQLGCPPDRHAGLFARQVRERAEKAEAEVARLSAIENWARMAVDGDVDESAKGWTRLHDALDQAPPEVDDDH